MKFKAIRELFYFTQKERNGIIALLCIIFILLAINFALPYLVKNKPVDTSEWEREVKSYSDQQKQQEQQSAFKEPEPFDPNNIGYVELSKLGVPDKVASNWIKYLEKGGRFKEKRDVRKIYGMTEELYEQLQDFFLIPVKVKVNPDTVKHYAVINNKAVQTKNDFDNGKSYTPVAAIELNSADSSALESLPGIGPVLASRIIRYRKLLGGFYSVEQLHEVYGLREEHYAAASPYINVDAELLRGFNLNFASLQELGRHPYIGFRMARKIIKLRDERGKYASAGDLSPIMTVDSLEKLKPYLTFNQ
jgi:competence protein ComEA